jgi:tellurite resistance protein TerC
MSGLRVARRIAIGVIGTTVVAIGVAMLVLPGPGLVVIPAGLGILGLEFAFARRWLQHLRDRASAVASKVSSSVSTSSRGDARKPIEGDESRH